MYVREQLSISDKTISKIIMYWWYKEMRPAFTEQSLYLRKNTKEVLRMDHTYKAVSSLGAVDRKGNWVHFVCCRD